MAARAKKEERQFTQAEIARMVAELPADELMKLASQIAGAAADKRKSGSDPYAHKRYGTSRDSLVQRLAAFQIFELYVVKGMSFRDIAELTGVSYERVRQLWLRFYPKDEKGADDAEAMGASA